MEKTAVVLGATGLVGSHVVEKLLKDASYAKIILLLRRASGINHSKIEEYVVDFDNPESWEHFVKGDVLFSAFGTTIKKAGSQANQYRIDYTYQYEVAKAAKKNGITRYVLVSSAGANAHAKMFYSRMKGELDEDVKKLNFATTVLLKPSVLVGVRNEKRKGESLAIVFGKLLTCLPGLRAYKPIHANIVAKAMLNGAALEGMHVFNLLEVFELAAK
jgi:uncharacterized protein YbjT (DUF2867 family)